MPVAKLLIGLAALTLGRQLYWVFVGVAGFVVGLELGTRLFHGRPDWMVVGLALVVGLLGALAAVFFQYLAVGAAGGLVGIYVALRLLDRAGVTGDTWPWVVALLGGVLGALLVLLVLDWALIGLSSLAGGALVTEALALGPPLAPVVFLGLVLAGIVVQATLFRRRPPPAPGPPRHS